MRIEGHPFTIIGVEPEGFSGLIIDGATDVTIPLLSPGQTGIRDPHDARLLWLRVYGRIGPGLKLAQARTMLETAWPHIQQATQPPGYEGERRARFFARKIAMTSAASGVSLLRQRFSSPLRVLLALVGAVLLIACLNLANLFIARATRQQQESGVRAALGANMWDLMAVRALGRHYSLRTMTVEERLDRYITAQRLTAMLATFFGGAALMIAAVGLYGLMSYQVTTRTAELGIRMALGAQERQIFSLILRESLLLVTAGSLAGTAASLAMGRLINNLLSGISASNPAIFCGAMLSLLVVALIPTSLPARKAASMDPMTALRVD